MTNEPIRIGELRMEHKDLTFLRSQLINEDPDKRDIVWQKRAELFNAETDKYNADLLVSKRKYSDTYQQPRSKIQTVLAADASETQQQHIRSSASTIDFPDSIEPIVIPDDSVTSDTLKNPPPERK